MIIAVTGEPKSGKSTFIQTFINGIGKRASLFGFFTKEISENNIRTGFKMMGSDGQEVTIANVNTPSKVKVGRFYVNTPAINGFVANFKNNKAEEFLYVDEIGQMQLSSDSFREFIKKSIKHHKDALIALSSVFHDPLIDSIKVMPDTFLFKLTQENRAEMLELANLLYTHRENLKGLSNTRQLLIRELFDKYLAQDNIVSLRKLLRNAIIYVADGKVSKKMNNRYHVSGEHGIHDVSFMSRDNWSCDCRLSNGEAPYEKSAECSHYQAVFILSQS